MRLSSFDLELSICKTICNTKRDNLRAYLIGRLSKAHFGYPPAKELFTRIINIVKQNKSVPKLKLFKDDLSLSKETRIAIKGKIKLINNKTEAKNSLTIIKNYYKVRLLYNGISNISDRLSDADDGKGFIIDKSIEHLEKVLRKAKEGADESELVHIGKGSNSKKVVNKILSAKVPELIPTGFYGFDSINYGLPTRGVFIEAANSGGGKCLVKDSIVNSNAGLLTMKEIWDSKNSTKKKGFLPKKINIYSHMGILSSSHVYKSKGKTIKIETHSGHCIEGRPEHKIIVFEKDAIKFKKLDTIKKWDIPILPYNQKLFNKKIVTFDSFKFSSTKKKMENKGYKVQSQYNGKFEYIQEISGLINNKVPKKMTKTLAKVLGYMLSEGNLFKKYNRGVFSNHDKEVRQDFIVNFKKCFGNRVKDTDTHVDIVGRKTINFLDYLGINKKSAKKDIPLCIRTSNRIFQIEFLKGLFEGNGYIYQKDKNRWIIAYSTTSNTLGTQLMCMLENLGIPTSRKFQQKYKSKLDTKLRRGNEIFILDKDRFIKNIGFISNRKLKVAKKYLQHNKWVIQETQNTSSKDCGDINKVPFGFIFKDTLNVIKDICKDLTYSVSYKHSISGNIVKYNKPTGFRSLVGQTLIKHYDRNKQIINKYAIYKLIQFINSWEHSTLELNNIKNQLKHLVYLDQRYSTVQNIKYYKEKDVYDLTIPKAHSYSANGFMNHNTVMAIQLLKNMYLESDKNTCLASFEMDKPEMYGRLLANISGVSHDRILQRTLSRKQKKIIKRSFIKFNKHGKKKKIRWSLYVPRDDVTFMDLMFRLKPYDYEVIVIDYISLLKMDAMDNQAASLGEITRQAKQWARKMKCLIIICAQMTDDDRIKYSRAIFENADNVWTWRYGERERETHVIDIKQDKARNQKTFSFPLLESYDTMSLSDFANSGSGKTYNKNKNKKKKGNRAEAMKALMEDDEDNPD